jgi:hypothetical protein
MSRAKARPLVVGGKTHLIPPPLGRGQVFCSEGCPLLKYGQDDINDSYYCAEGFGLSCNSGHDVFPGPGCPQYEEEK